MQCVAVCCSVLQRVAVCCSVLRELRVHLWVFVSNCVTEKLIFVLLTEHTHTHTQRDDTTHNTLQHTATRC